MTKKVIDDHDDNTAFILFYLFKLELIRVINI